MSAPDQSTWLRPCRHRWANHRRQLSHATPEAPSASGPGPRPRQGLSSMVPPLAPAGGHKDRPRALVALGDLELRLRCKPRPHQQTPQPSARRGQPASGAAGAGRGLGAGRQTGPANASRADEKRRRVHGSQTAQQVAQRLRPEVRPQIVRQADRSYCRAHRQRQVGPGPEAWRARRGGEIVNADSMQIYAGLPVLTAAPSPDEQAQAPHHLFGVADAADGWSVGQLADGGDAGPGRDRRAGPPRHRGGRHGPLFPRPDPRPGRRAAGVRDPARGLGPALRRPGRARSSATSWPSSTPRPRSASRSATASAWSAPTPWPSPPASR